MFLNTLIPVVYNTGCEISYQIPTPMYASDMNESD